MIYCQIKFHIPSSNDIFGDTVKQESRYLLDAILLLTLHKNNCLNKRCMSFKDLVSFKISRYYLSDTSVIPTSLITVMLVLLMVENYKVQRWIKHDTHTKYQSLCMCPTVTGGTDTRAWWNYIPILPYK